MIVLKEIRNNRHNTVCRGLHIIQSITTVLLIFLLFSPASAYGQTADLKKILVLHSYHQGLVWTDDIMEGIYSVFDKYNPDLEIHVEYMDTKRHFDGFDGVYIKNLRNQYKEKYKNMKLDVIISSDDNAFQFLLMHHKELFPGTPIVFCGVNDFEDSMLYGHEGITGVLELLDQKASIDVGLMLHPETEEIALITEKTISGSRNRKILEELADQYMGRVKFVFLDADKSGLTLQELLNKLTQLKERSIVFYSDFLRSKGEYIIQEIAVPQISRTSSRPVYTHYDEILGLGVVGGKLVNGTSHGKTAAQIAERILNGTPVRDLPVHKESINKFMFDHTQLKRFNIEESDLPQGSIIINKPESFYLINKHLFHEALLGIVALLISFVVSIANILKRRNVERALLKANEELDSKVRERTAALSLNVEQLKEEIIKSHVAEEKLKKSRNLLNSIKEAQGLFIAHSDHSKVFQHLLETLVSVTDSEYGFLDEVLQDETGASYKRSLALSNIAWDNGSRRLYEELSKSNFEFRNLDNLSGEPVRTGELVISDDPSHDPRSGGLPEGHPPLNSYMGIPLYYGKELVGVAGLANRRDGYTKDLASSLTPFTSTCAGIISAIRSERAEKNLLAQISQNESDLKAITSSIGEGILVLNKDYTITFANPEACRLLGWEETELTGNVMIDVVHCYSSEGEKMSDAECTIVKSIDTGKPFRVSDGMFNRKDGSVFPVSFISTPLIKDGKAIGSVTVFQDITQRKRAEEALLREKEKLQKYLDISAVMVVMINADGTVAIINKKGCDLLGYKEEDIIGKNWIENFVPERLRKEVKHVFAMLMSGEIDPVEYYENEVLNRNGEEILIAWYNTVFKDDKGRIIHALSSGVDITERKKAEDQIKKSLREKEVLLQEIHHRVKNNMAIISSLLKLQSDQVKDGKLRELFHDSMSRIKTMSLVHEKLYRSKDLANIYFDDYLKDMIESLFISCGVLAGRIALATDFEKITLGVDESIPCGLIISELITNSLKHAFPPGSSGEIRVKLRIKDDNEIELEMSDNGIGLPTDINMGNITTLGLNLVDTLVKQLRGSIELYRENGTRYRITFRRPVR